VVQTDPRPLITTRTEDAGYDCRNDSALEAVRKILNLLLRRIIHPEPAAQSGMTVPDPTTETSYREVVSPEEEKLQVQRGDD
jgi:hypothetical protein